MDTPRANAPAAGARSSSAASEKLLAERIRQASGGEGASGARDVFRVSPHWDGTGGAKGSTGSIAASNALPFEQAHRLTGLIAAGRRSSAIVDGKLLLLGQAVDGYRLTAVTQDEATFVSGEGRVVLRLQGPTGRAR